MTFDPSGDYDESRVLLTKEGIYEGHQFQAYCGPDSQGEDYDADGNVVTEKPTDIPTDNWSRQQFGAPFPVDVVFTDEIPDPETVAEIRDQLGPEFGDQFMQKTSEVYERINESDDPLQEVLDLEPDELKVASFNNA